MKFFIYLLGYLLYPVSFLIPRKKTKWAFGSSRGAFNDNAKYLYIYVKENRPEVDAVWISESKQTVEKIRSIGLKSYYIGSLKGIWHALRSKYWFFNSYTSDILFFASGNAVCINLWHGVGLKKIEFSISSGKLANLYKKKSFKEVFYHPQVFRRPDYFISTTNFQSVKFAEAFRIKLSQCLNIGYSRNTVLLMDELQRLEFIQKYENRDTLKLIDRMKMYDKIYIYMPTWRDSQRDIFLENIDLFLLDELMKDKNSLFIAKPHSNTKIDIEFFSSFSNVLLLDSKTDVYGVLPYIDVLITDYSSVLYDFILMNNKDVILYLYDINEYINDRDFNYSFYENIVGKEVFNFSELIDCLKNEDYKINETKRSEILTKFWQKENLLEVNELILKNVI